MEDTANAAKTDRAFAAEFFNDTWKLLEKPQRTEEEIDAMIHGSHASLHHWMRTPGVTPTNRAIGYWQLSRVYAVSGIVGEAERYAQRCLAAARSAGAERWVAGSACEALARAASLRGDRAARDRYLAEARAIAAKESDEETRAILNRDIESVP